MTNANRTHVTLDRIHAQAVCQGIGDRLRASLDQSWGPASEKLDELHDRLAELDTDRAPWIVPTLPKIF